ncbi:grasp-with-spasm system ATP-grasp peptide maturase [Gaetbulibacter jejuensis]|uniref:ATP-GRASP peptide maturase of grasp-with-spasm system n=1 Tax=Gaetbulibacter jejuensis TaxID=584607 RepID=A0ABN1JN16_9FLAO
MHIIISDKFDQPTNQTLKWFNYHEKDVIVIDKSSFISVDFRNGFDCPVLLLEDYNLSITSIESVWFRRGRFRLNYDYLDRLDEEAIKKFHNQTHYIIETYFNSLIFSKIKCLGNPFKISVNKLEVLLLAKEIGLKIPETMLTDKINDVDCFFKDKPAITKLLVNMNNFSTDKQKINYFTFNYDRELLAEEELSISLFQEKIIKKYEIRAFYLNNKVYSKAIFSQIDDKTKDDYRNYNLDKPNRETRFALPKDIETKIKKLMYRLDLNTGSIDLIVDENNDYIFLEVNPVGQFFDLSYNCNYKLDKIIYDYLVDYEK